MEKSSMPKVAYLEKNVSFDYFLIFAFFNFGSLAIQKINVNAPKAKPYFS
jgi:hypothetical protein